MKKLIAQRPIQYMGQGYKRGDALPAADPQMVGAWLRAGSAVWDGGGVPPVPQAISYRTPELEAADVLAALDVRIVDDDGAFIGEDALIQSIVSAVRALDEDTLDFEEAGAELNANEDGHLSKAGLEKLTKAELQDLAAELGVDLSACKNNAERVEALAACMEGERPPEGGA